MLNSTVSSARVRIAIVALFVAALLSVGLCIAPTTAHAVTKQQQATTLLTKAVTSHKTDFVDVKSAGITKAVWDKAFDTAVKTHYGQDKWAINKITYSTYKKNGTVYVSKIKLAYELSSSQINNAAKKAKTQTSSVIKGKKSAKDKAKAIHDWIIKNTAYYTASAKWGKVSLNRSRTTYAVLYNHRGNCAGYSGTFKAMCNDAGISCEVIYGTRNGKQHAWNKVKLNGSWYYVDVTCDDPLVNGKKDSTKVYTTYWLKSKKWMTSHGYKFITN